MLHFYRLLLIIMIRNTNKDFVNEIYPCQVNLNSLKSSFDVYLSFTEHSKFSLKVLLHQNYLFANEL